MGKLKNYEYAKLDNLIAEHGKEFVIGQVITRVAEGCSLKDIAHSFGIHFVYLKRWMEEECSEDIGLALRARADILEHQATTAVDMADPDSVAVARLQADHYMKVAKVFDRKKYADKETQETGGNGLVLPHFQINFISAPQVHHEKIIIEHEVERLIIQND